MSKKDRRDNERRGDRRETQPDENQQHQGGEHEAQESDSLAALKAILARVAALLKPLQLTTDESIRLVEELYSKVLETDLQLAGEADDTRKSSVLEAVQHATIRREAGKIVIQYPAEIPATPSEESSEEKPETTTSAPAEPLPAEPKRRRPARRNPAESEPSSDEPTTTEAGPGEEQHDEA